MARLSVQQKNKNTATEYKSSYYNYLYETDAISLLYNTYTGAMAKLFGEDKESVIALLKAPNNMGLQKRNPSIWQDLLNNGFVVDKNMNELDFIRLRLLKSRFDVHSLSFTLVPTRACNCRCVYCFEEPMNSSMGKDDCIETAKFIKSQIEEIKPLNLVTIWYGGEPLLATETMEFLSEALMRICEESGILYIAHLISNGYLLSESLVFKLKKMGIETIQITLDGPERIHNQRRVLKNGGPTFQRLKEAILISKRIFKNVVIRIHVDQVNKQSIYDLLKEEWLYGDNVRIEPGYLKDFSALCMDWRSNKKAISPRDFFMMEEHFDQLGVRKNSKEENHNYEALVNSIPVKGRYCGADYMGHWIIGPGALAYKCLSSLNINDECGYLKNGKFYPNQNFTYWFLNTPIDDKNCQCCKLLPLCMGGCPTIRKRYSSILKSGICGYWNFYLEETLKKIIQKMGYQK